MIKTEKFMIVKYSSIDISKKDTVGFRGFFADIDRSADAVHNHMEDGTVIYRYPQVQYKVVGGHPMIVAFDQGIRDIYPMVMESTELTIYDKQYINPEVHFDLCRKSIGDSKEVICYKMISPWIGLNQDNYKKYMSLEQEEDKTTLLNKILVGNILSLCKGFGVTIENRLSVESDMKPITVRYKKEKMLGFKGSFTVNACLPSYCGLGKGVSLGYGAFIKTGNNSNEPDCSST